MNYAETLKKGTSSCYFDGLSYENFKTAADNGIDCIEISRNFNGYIGFAADAERIAADAERAGVSLWSIHMPFSRQLDISSAEDEGRELCMKTNLELIAAAGKIGIKVAVLHPSSEPIAEEDRPARLVRSRENILRTAEKCATA